MPNTNSMLIGRWKIARKNLILLVLSGWMFTQAIAQEGPPSAQLDLPVFHLDAVSFASDKPLVSRLEVFIQLPYEMLSFTKEEELYHSGFELSITIRDSTGAIIDEKLSRENVETKNYTESVSKTVGKITQKTFLLGPAKYTLTVQVSDIETKKTAKVERVVVVKDYSSRFGISDIMLASSLSAENGKTVIVPNVSANVGDLKDGFHLYFEAYDRTTIDSAGFEYEVRTLGGEVIKRDSIMKSLKKEKNSCFMKVDSKNFPPGDYIINVHGELVHSGVDSAQNTEVVFSSRSFTVHVRGLPISIVDLDKAIDQMMYIADRDATDEIKNAPPEKKREKFLEFWKQRDPSPNTDFNELMEEYYQRVDYANKNFSTYIEGWRSDRGMVYIVFGVPSNIERHPFDMDAKPYEIWTYYQLSRDFVFVDMTGFGDYRLQNPTWDTWRYRYH